MFICVGIRTCRRLTACPTLSAPETLKLWKCTMNDQPPYSQRLLYADKNEPKRAPGCTGPSGFLVLLADDGTLKTHRLRRLRQVQRLIPSTAAMLSGTERVFLFIFKVKGFCHFTQPSSTSQERKSDSAGPGSTPQGGKL